ncbi:MAG: hypothetical protein EHM59_05580 [Betaproteobacteria bacterium]|nr:MAG: hypothetical protein EHM59_05580 [Betaproteobacteria bacterium]
MQAWPGRSDELWEQAQDEMMAAGLSDGLPIVPPTADRVERMLSKHWVDPDEVLCQLAPLFVPVTWRDLAINAVMAGCKPEYLPVVAAAVEALAGAEFNLIGISTTTGSAGTLVIVNGPIAPALGMNAAANALGPGNRANATVGRAVRLVLQNVGGAKPGEIDMATLGQPAKYTFCMAENETASPWDPLHVERGFARDASVVTVVGTAGIVEVVDSCSRTPAELAQTFAHSMLIAGTVGGGGLLGGGEPLIVLPPEQAVFLAQAGCSKLQFKREIWERAVMGLDMLSASVREHLTGRLGEASGVDSGAPLRVAEKPEDIMLVVAGGVGVKAAYVPTWGGSTRAVSRPVR